MSDQLTSVFERFVSSVEGAKRLAHVPDPETPVIEVDEAIKSIAKFYEKTRNALEYGEADFLRRRAVERSLRRILSMGTLKDPDGVALDMLRELIRAGYLPNDEIPETAAQPIGLILEKLFVAILQASSLFHDELVQFAVYEIEDVIFPERTAMQMATVAYVIEVCDERLRWPREMQDSAAHRAFLFVAAYKIVLKADQTRILYAFVRDALPEWREADAGRTATLIEDFERVLQAAKRTVAHPHSEQYARSMRRLAPAFRALEDAVTEGIGESVSTLQLERRLEDAVQTRIGQAAKKLKSLALRATLYVIFTKMVIGLAVEMPLNIYLVGKVAPLPFAINLIFPPALMFFVAWTARPPKPEVAERIIEDAMRVATEEGVLGHAKVPRPRGAARLAVFILMLIGFAGLALNILFRGTAALDFTLIDTGIFLIFLSVISLFAWRVRQPLRELAASRRSGVVWMFVEVLVFPFLALGRVLSDGIKRINIFLWLLDVVIEAPLKLFFASFEDWVAFLREKREEILGE